MLKKVYILVILFVVGFFLFDASLAFAADRYWVAGTGNWNDATNHWSASSGGAPGIGNLPTASDNCIFDTNSNTTDTGYAVTVNASATCLDFTMDGPGSGANITWAGSSALAIYGSMNLIGGSADITRSYTGTISFNATSGVKTVDTNGVSLNSNISFNGVGGSWQLLDSLNIGNKAITLGNGSLDTNSQTVIASSSTGGLVSTGTIVRSLTLGASTVQLGAGCVNFTDSTNLTLNAGTSTINCNAVTSFRGGGNTFYDVNLTSSSGSGIIPIIGANTFNNLTLNGSSNNTFGFSLGSDQVVNGIFTANGDSSIVRILVKSDTLGTPRTITAASATGSNVDFQDITGAGVASWDLSAITGDSGDAGGNIGITFTTADTQYWIGDTGNWSDSTKWSLASGGGNTGRVPLPQDDVVFDANSFSSTSQTVTIDMYRLGKNITFAGDGSGAVLNTPTVDAVSDTNIYGSLTLVSDMIVSANQTINLESRSLSTLTSAGHTILSGININAFSGTYTLGDAFNVGATRVLTLNYGTFDANDYDVNVGNFSSSNTNTRTLNMGSGVWNLTGIDTVWDLGSTTNLTLNEETSTLKITDTSGSAKSFTSESGQTYYNFWIDSGMSTADFYVDGSNTFNDFKDTGTVAHNIFFSNGTTQTVNTFTVSGTPGNLITLNSGNDLDTFALVKSGGGTISSDYLNIQHSVATPADTWYAGLNSIDNQLVAEVGSGWIFTAPPAIEETSNRSSSGSARRVVRQETIPIFIPTPNTLNVTLECLPGHKFSNITGLPCSNNVEVNTPNTPQNEDSNKFIFTKNLWAKMIDPDVKELQKYLNTHGFPVALSGLGSSGYETNLFGNLTIVALKKFQIANNLTSDGIFGPITRGVINAN